MRIDPEKFRQAADNFDAVSTQAFSYGASARGTLNGFGGMAGTDPGGESFAEAYDEMAAAALQGFYDTGASARGMDRGLMSCAGTHAQANANAGYITYDAAAVYVLRSPVEEATVVAPPSAFGGRPDTMVEGLDSAAVWIWDQILNLVGTLFPDGDPEKLRQAGSSWQTILGDLQSLSTSVSAADSPLAGIESGEMASIQTKVADFSDGLRRFIADEDGIGRIDDICGEYADTIEETQRESRQMMVQLVIEIVASMAVGGLLSVVTFGASAVVAGGTIAARIAMIGARIAALVQRCVAAAMRLSSKLRAIVTALRAAGQNFPRLTRASIEIVSGTTGALAAETVDPNPNFFAAFAGGFGGSGVTAAMTAPFGRAGQRFLTQALANGTGGVAGTALDLGVRGEEITPTALALSAGLGVAMSARFPSRRGPNATNVDGGGIRTPNAEAPAGTGSDPTAAGGDGGGPVQTSYDGPAGAGNEVSGSGGDGGGAPADHGTAPGETEIVVTPSADSGDGSPAGEPVSQPAPDAGPAPDAQPDPTPDAGSEPDPTPTPQPDPTPEAQPDPTPAQDAGPASEPDPTPQPEPAPEAQPDPTPRPEQTTDPSPDPDPAPTPDAGPEPGAQSDPTPDAGSEPGAQPDPTPEPEPAPDAQSDPGAEGGEASQGGQGQVPRGPGGESDGPVRRGDEEDTPSDGADPEGDGSDRGDPDGDGSGRGDPDGSDDDAVPPQNPRMDTLYGADGERLSFEDWDSQHSDGTGSNSSKGEYGELRAQDYMESQGWTRIDAGADGSHNTNANGIDGIYVRERPDGTNEYAVIEAKYNTARLGNSVDGRQMSGDWLTGATSGTNRIDGAMEGVDQTHIDGVNDALDSGDLQSGVIRVTPDGDVRVRQLDADGYVVRNTADAFDGPSKADDGSTTPTADGGSQSSRPGGSAAPHVPGLASQPEIPAPDGSSNGNNEGGSDDVPPAGPETSSEPHGDEVAGEASPQTGDTLTAAQIQQLADEGYQVAFFDTQAYNRFYEPVHNPNPTLGPPGGRFWVMPLADGAHVRNASDAFRATGASPATMRAYTGYEVDFSTNTPDLNRPVRASDRGIVAVVFQPDAANPPVRPTQTDADGWPHYLENTRTDAGGNPEPYGHTALLGEGPNAGYLTNPHIREMVINGGDVVYPGSLFVRIEDGNWIVERVI